MELLFLNVGYSISLLDSKPITLGIKNEAVTCPVSCVLWITIEFLPTAHLTFSALVTLTSSWFISHVKVTFVFEVLLRILCPNVSHPERRSVFSFSFFLHFFSSLRHCHFMRGFPDLTYISVSHLLYPLCPTLLFFIALSGWFLYCPVFPLSHNLFRRKFA